ncbi:hypothetical protein H8356DRAFT_1344699 [Neocallimastix lanati (nom. inval.)]|nr:hypothetical protein H8356DRAFT_1344699 [Neocallimastix sp. JGI-2020a]
MNSHVYPILYIWACKEHIYFAEVAPVDIIGYTTTLGCYVSGINTYLKLSHYNPYTLSPNPIGKIRSRIDTSRVESPSNKGEEQIIINKQYKFNFSHSRKDNSRVYKCTEYKKNNKCKSFIILNNEKEILKYESLHNHPGNEYSVSLSVMKHKIKDEIKKHSNPFDIKRKRLYNEISKEMGFIYPCPEYISVKTLILRIPFAGCKMFLMEQITITKKNKKTTKTTLSITIL